MTVIVARPADSLATRYLARWELLTGGLLLAVIGLLVALGPSLAGHDPAFVDLRGRLLPPHSPQHLLGTDQLGRDLFARLLHGLRWSLAAATGATLLAFTTGTLLGLLAARRHSPLATLIRQVTNFAQSFPVLVLAICLVAIVGNSLATVVLVLGLVTWPVFCRVVQAEAASLFAREYVLAAEMLQMSRLRLYFRHVVPGLLPSLSVLLAFHFADMLIAESALSFLGIGAPLGAATWGNMLQESRAYLLSAPWLLLVPASAIVMLVITANLLGDGLRRHLE
ncbi:MAG TPA: ABC transporter permease [Steroidobacteraceae bacterium]